MNNFQFLVVIIALLPLTVAAQTKIGRQRSAVRKDLQEAEKKATGYTVNISEDSASVTYTITGSAGTKPVEFSYEFDEKNVCIIEKVVTHCDSCFRQYLGNVLGNKRYGWKKINENQYISDYKSMMLIEVPPENNDFSFAVLRTQWDKELYKILVGK